MGCSRPEQLFAFIALALFVSIAPVARAQSPVRLAVLQAGAEDAELAPLAATLDPVILQELNQLDVVKVATRPVLDLGSVQLALDCVGETIQCLRAVTQHTQTEGLLAPTLRKNGSQTMLALLYFDGREEGEIEIVTRRYGGEAVETQMLDEVGQALRELFGLTPPAAPDAGSRTEFDLAYSAEPRQRALPVVPIVVGAVGAALVLTGGAFGIMAKRSEDQYARIDIAGDEARARTAQRRLETAERQALIANLGYGIGGAALATGVVLWFLMNDSREEPEALSLAPAVGPGLVGLSMQGRWPAQ